MNAFFVFPVRLKKFNNSTVPPLLKSPAAYYLMLVYLFALCKPVMPLLQDMVAHTFFEHEHIATVHQHGGTSHVKNEVGKLAEKESTEKNTDGAKSYNTVPLHLNALIAFQFTSFKAANISHSSFYSSGLSSLALAIQLPPPRV